MPRHAMFRAMQLIALAALVWTTPALAGWMWDTNQNRIDDRIEQVEVQGPTAAHVGGVLTGRLRFALMNVSAPYTYGVYVGYDHHPTDDDVAFLAGAGVAAQVRYRAIDYIRTELTFAQAQAVAQMPGVVRIETIPVLYAVNDIASRVLRARPSSQYFHPSVWGDLGFTGKGVVVGVLDTGVNDEADATVGYPGHESLRGKFVGGGNFFSGQPALNTPIDQSENPKHTADPEATYHGTHVAGTAIGSGGPQGMLDGASPGTFAGIAPDARLVDCKVLSDAGLGFGATDALDWCIYHRFDTWGLAGADSIYRGIQVLNLSLGGSDNSDGTDATSAAVNAASRAGIVVCVATGNDGNTHWMASPCAADLAVSVGAFTDNNTLDRGDDIVSDYSNEGPRLDDGDETHLDEMKPSVLGSGTGILSALGDPTTQGNLYHHINGTSMATPTIAGVCALILQANRTLSATQVRDILQNTSDHRTDHGKQPAAAADTFGIDPNYHPSWGWGEVDAYAAVKEALNNAATQVVRVSATPVRGPDGVRVDWVSQREVDLFRYEVQRAPDDFGIPGAWVTRTQVAVPTQHPEILRQPNRHPYSWTDLDATLVPSNTYWYRVRWTDYHGLTHVEPAVHVRIADSPVVARVKFSWTHNYSDGDLVVKYGTGTNPSNPHWMRFAPGAPAADSVVTVPGVSFTGTLRHYFHFDLTAEDVVGGFLPPSAANPWFLSVKEGGFVNTKGTVNDFSIVVFDGASSVTYVSPNPATPTIEKQETVFWIPLDPATSLTHAPVLSPIGPRRTAEGLPLAFDVAGSDPDGDALTFSAASLPAGATFDAPSRHFSWLPSHTQAGTYSVSFRVNSGTGLGAAGDSEVVAITVTDRAPGSNLPPALEPIGDRQAFTGERLSFRVMGRDPESQVLSYSATTELPDGGAFDGTTGTFAWSPNPSQVGTHSFTLRATDPGGLFAEQSMLVTVSEAGIGPAPPLSCEEASSIHSGTIGAGMDPGDKSVVYVGFDVPSAVQRIEGALMFALAPVRDLDFYLLDADSNVVQSSASTDAPETIVYNTPSGGHYIWKVIAFTNPDTAQFSISQDVCIATATGVESPRAGLSLGPAYPNPTRGRTTMVFSLPEAGDVRLRVHDVAGRLVQTLESGRLAPGRHTATWDRRNDRGQLVASGMYFVRLEASGRTFGRKVIVIP